MKKTASIEQINKDWERITERFRKNAEELRESLEITAEDSIKKLEEAEGKLREAWNSSHAGFQLIGFKLDIQQTSTLYPVNAWLMFTPVDGAEPSWELSTRFGGAVSQLIDWVYDEVGVDRGIQLELKIPMFHEV